MNPIEAVLKKWEEKSDWNGWWPDEAIEEMADDIRAALKDCSILTWHPRSERPERDGYYLARIRYASNGGDINPFSKPCIEEFYSVTVFQVPMWLAEEGRDYTVIEWAELPERGK